MDIEEIKEKIKKEGDYKAFEHKGFKCRIIRNPKKNVFIHLCGYVGIPEGHKYYNKSYSEINVDVHGGLTYSENYLFCQPEQNLWWIGFDCAHLYDVSNLEDMVFLEDMVLDYSYKTMDYVENELINLVNQL